MQPRCRGTNKAGEPCGAKALAGSAYCVVHDPSRVTDLAEWRRKGGEARSNRARARKALAGGTGRLDVAARVLDAMGKVEQGEMQHGPANAIANLARAYIAVMGDTELHERLSDMERLVAEMRAS